MIPFPILSYRQTRHTQYHKWRYYIFPLIATIPFVQFFRWNWSTFQFQFHSHPICFELSAFASIIKTSYYCRKSVITKPFPAAPVDTFYRTLIISFLTVLPLGIHANQSLALHSGVWLNWWVSVKFLCFSISRKRLGSTATIQSNRFKKEKQCSMLNRLLKITRQVFRIRKNLLLCSNNFSVNISIVLIGVDRGKPAPSLNRNATNHSNVTKKPCFSFFYDFLCITVIKNYMVDQEARASSMRFCQPI